MKSVVFFDIDGVLMKAQTQELFVKFLFFKKKMSTWKVSVIILWFLAYKMGIVKDVVRIREFAFKVFEGWDAATMNQLMDQFYEKYLSLNLNPSLIERLKMHQLRGDVVIILSATIKEIAEYLARNLNVNAVIATELEILDGKYTGKIKGDIPYGEIKSKFIEEFILKNNFSLNETYAYADHITDLPMLKLVRRPVVINPESKLRVIAKDLGWEIL